MPLKKLFMNWSLIFPLVLNTDGRSDRLAYVIYTTCRSCYLVDSGYSSFYYILLLEPPPPPPSFPNAGYRPELTHNQAHVTNRKIPVDINKCFGITRTPSEDSDQLYAAVNQ